MAKAVRLELRRIERGQKHKTAEQLAAYLDEIRRAVAGQISGQYKADPFAKKDAGKRARSAARAEERRPGVSGKFPPTFMRKKIQVGKVPGSAPPKENVG